MSTDFFQLDHTAFYRKLERMKQHRKPSLFGIPAIRRIHAFYEGKMIP